MFLSEESGNRGDPVTSEVHSASIQLNPILHHCCSDKAIADSLEALVGVFLLSLGLEGAWSVLEWLGMDLNKHEIRDAHSQGAPCVHDSSVEETKEFDSIESKQSMSKIPCGTDQTSCESQPNLSRDFSCDRSSDTQMMPQDEAPENCCKDIAETSCQRKNQSFPEMLHDHSTKGSLSNAVRHLMNTYRSPNRVFMKLTSLALRQSQPFFLSILTVLSAQATDLSLQNSWRLKRR